MGTELDAFPFQELINQSNTTPSSRTVSPFEILSSWLDIDEANYHPPPSPSLHPQDHLLGFHLSEQDQHLFHFGSSDFDVDPLSLLPRPDSPFLHGLYQSDSQVMTHDCHHLPITADEKPQEPDEFDTFLIDSNEFGLITPTDSHDSGSDDHSYDVPSAGNKMAASDYSYSVDTPEAMSSDNTTPPPASAHGDVDADGDDNEEEEEVDEEVPKPGTVHCKNLVSERNRRKRLSQQLLALRALVPNITKMDKRSVLVDALNYLRNIHDETARLQKEIKQQQQQQQQHPRFNDIKESCQDNPSGTLRVPRTSPASKPKPQILEIDTERIEDRRFVVKITCKGSNGVGGDIVRVIESMGLEITNATVQQMGPQEILATIFVKVRKPGKMTEEKLKDCITSMALRSGLTLQNP